MLRSPIPHPQNNEKFQLKRAAWYDKLITLVYYLPCGCCYADADGGKGYDSLESLIMSAEGVRMQSHILHVISQAKGQSR